MSKGRLLKIGQGFTLVEILIGLGILGVVSLGFLLSMRSSSREMQFASEHFSAVLLAQKVMEDCAQEAQLNPYAFECLGIEGESETTLIAKGASIFFSELEDSRPPWNHIDKTTDGAIDETTPVLYRQVGSFTLRTEANRLAAPMSDDPLQNLARLKITLSWPARAGKGEYTAVGLLGVPITPKIVDHGISYTEEEIKKAGCISLFDTVNGNFSSLVAESGGNPDMLLSLAKVQTGCDGFLVSKYFVETFQTLKDGLSQCQTLDYTTPTQATFAFTEKLAEQSFSFAREGYRFIRYLDPEAKRLSGLTPAHLGSYLTGNPGNYKMVLYDYKRLVETVLWSLDIARSMQEALVMPGMADFQTRKKQFHYLLKLITTYRLLLVAGGMGTIDKAAYVRLWSALEKFGAASNPALRRMADLEIQLGRNPDRMLEKYPALTEFHQTMENAATFIKSYPALSPYSPLPNFPLGPEDLKDPDE